MKKRQSKRIRWRGFVSVMAAVAMLMLTGCAVTQAPVIPKPSLSPYVMPSGDMCLSPEDTERLALYLLQLEEAVQ